MSSNASLISLLNWYANPKRWMESMKFSSSEDFLAVAFSSFLSYDSWATCTSKILYMNKRMLEMLD